MPKRYPLVRYVGLASLLGLGAQVVYAVLFFWVVGVGGQFADDRGIREELQIQTDGTPVIVTQVAPYNDLTGRIGRTLDGDSVPYEQLNQKHFGSDLPGSKEPPRRFGRIAWKDRIGSFNDGRVPNVWWYFIHGGRRGSQGYFVGFDKKTKLQVGYIGAGGFRTDEPPTEELFPVDGRRVGGARVVGSGDHLTSQSREFWLHVKTGSPNSSRDLSGQGMPDRRLYLISGKRLWEIDLHERSVRVLLERDGLVSVGICSPANPSGIARNPAYEKTHPVHLAIRTQDRVLVFDRRTGESESYPIPEEVRQTLLSLYELDDQRGILLHNRRGFDSGYETGKWSDKLYWVDRQRQIVRTETIVLDRGGIDMDHLVAVCQLSLYFPGAIAPTIAIFAGPPLWSMIAGETTSYPVALGGALWALSPALLITFALAGVMVRLCLKRQRRYALPGTRTWVVFIALFGVPAMVGYLLCRRWPVRAPCPACEQPVPRDRESCSSCDTPFPEPALKGTEVFA